MKGTLKLHKLNCNKIVSYNIVKALPNEHQLMEDYAKVSQRRSQQFLAEKGYFKIFEWKDLRGSGIFCDFSQKTLPN